MSKIKESQSEQIMIALYERRPLINLIRYILLLKSQRRGHTHQKQVDKRIEM